MFTFLIALAGIPVAAAFIIVTMGITYLQTATKLCPPELYQELVKAEQERFKYRSRATFT